MKIGFVGAGKAGFSLGKYFVEHDFKVSGYYSRNIASAEEAGAFTQTCCYEKPEDIVRESDILFLTVPDGKIHEVYQEIRRMDIAGKCICHCSGALSTRVFSDIREQGAYGYSVHPVCAINDKKNGWQELSGAYFTIEGDRQYLGKLQEMIQSLGNPVELITPEVKPKYHLAAVFASNLVEGLYDQAAELMMECGLSEEFARGALVPLFLQNAKNIGKHGVEQALTGPVERADADTIERHLQAVQGDTREIYRLLSRQLVEIAKRKNPGREYDKISEMLEE